jgi:hypothetical protein
MRFLLILLVIYLVYRIIFNFVLPLAARYFFSKATNGMQGGFQQQQNRTRRTGEVRIESEPKSTRKINPEDGEFVDYTEIK